jgi:hypothetical protein
VSHHGDVANDEGQEPVAAPRRRGRPPRCLRVAADPAVGPGTADEASGQIQISGQVPTSDRVPNGRVDAVVRVRLAPSASRSGFERYLRTLAGVLGAWRVTGDVDYELLIACPATADIEGELICLRCYGGTEVSSVGLVLREVSGLRTARRLVRAAGHGRFDDRH